MAARKPKRFNVGSAASGRFEATAQYQVLRGCPACGAPHPLAHKPPMPSHRCPRCGGPAGQAEVIRDADTALTDKSIAGRIGRFFLWLGRVTHGIAKRL